MKNVYILTQKGLGYTDEGLAFISESIRKDFEDFSDLRFCMGIAYNNANLLRKELERHSDAYVVISHRNGMEIISERDFDILIEGLIHDTTVSSWSVAYGIFTNEPYREEMINN